ncbi:hypothetical protein CBS147332_9224 [Penicillium roqueforti]|nr:hypothetical protein CBS147332_9224 [Penicillium roqueforti]KAI3103745.1 hypothetical protein CBS147331_7349 [Penicillium roqueforti]
MSTNTGKDLEDSFGDAVDYSVFCQILEMDDDPDDREFSTSICYGFFEQAEETFERMGLAITEGELRQINELAHFLKNSSATIGIVKVQKGCEKIQHYGMNEDLDGSPEPNSELCLRRIVEALEDVKADYSYAERKIKAFYSNPEVE